MTCIVALKRDGKVWVGGDRVMSTDDGEIRQLKTAKVFRVGEAVIGAAGYFRMLQLMQHGFTLPDNPQNEGIGYMVNTFVPALRKYLVDRNYMKADTDDIEDTLVVAYRGEVYEIAGRFAVLEYPEDYLAIGSGAPYALGAMYAMEYEMDAMVVIETALEAAEKFNQYVGIPFDILTSESVPRFYPLEDKNNGNC